MLKTERKCSTISQLSNVNQLYVNNYKDGTVKKEISGNEVRYSASNVNNCELFSRINFFHQCPSLNWKDDILPLIEQTKFETDNILFFAITINHERCMQQFELDNTHFTNDMLSTFLEMRLTIKTNNSVLNIKRNICRKALLGKDALIHLIYSELKKIDRQYSSFATLDLIAIDPEKYEIILPAGIGGIYVHEALGHCLEGDLFFRKDNILHGKLGHRIYLRLI